MTGLNPPVDLGKTNKLETRLNSSVFFTAPFNNKPLTSLLQISVCLAVKTIGLDAPWAGGDSSSTPKPFSITFKTQNRLLGFAKEERNASVFTRTGSRTRCLRYWVERTCCCGCKNCSSLLEGLGELRLVGRNWPADPCFIPGSSDDHRSGCRGDYDCSRSCWFLDV